MEQSSYAQTLLELIAAIDSTKTDLASLYPVIEPYVLKLADELSVAKADIHILTDPNPLEPGGDEKHYSLQFNGEAGLRAEAFEQTFEKVRHITSAVKLYACVGHVWTDQERQNIAAIAKLIYTSISRARMLEYQQRIGLVDLLTGLCNTAGAIQFGKRIAAENLQSEYAGCFMNLKNLKFINRQVSNHVGDLAMCQYAHVLYGLLDPEREMLARLGGDNFFALVLKEHLNAFLSKAVSLPLEIEHDGRKHAITLGAWVGVYPANGGESPRDLLDYASFAYEVAKRSKTTVAYFDPSMMEDSMHARQISQALPLALENRELMPYYQPKVSLHGGTLYGCEALVRWWHEGRMVSPAEFIPVAENSDLITRLDLYMLDAVCWDIRNWLRAGIEPVPVSINYSQRDFYSETLIEDTLKILNKYGIDGKYLEIEITETSFFENFEALEQFVEVMHQHGIRVSLDDFGTGYSSLTMFESLNLDTVKLDRSFFLNMERSNDKGRLVLRSVADMLNQLDKVIVSEGVKTPDQLNIVEEIGCDIVQGFYFDKPLPHDDFTQRLKERHYKVKE